MKTIIIPTLLLAILILPQTIQAAVMVFVHGLGGFGPNELLGVGYWGFPGFYGSSRDYLQQERDCGIFSGCQNSVFYASVGPISSNWDRACELYAQIKGTLTDYGYQHSRDNSHNRFGVDYTGKGFYPSWSSSNPIHLIGHSMGGQTIRMLEYLLQKGEAAEVTGTAGVSPGVSPLFVGGNKGWIKSIHTISTPHNGSPLHTALGPTLVSSIKDFIVALGKGVSYIPFAGDWFYDFDLGQFGWVRTPGEDQWTYFDSILNQQIWSSGYKDLASYDLSVEAAYYFNGKTDYTYPETFYVSHTTSRTTPCNPSDSCPSGMEVPMAVTGTIIGSISHNANACQTNIQCNYQNEWCHNPSSPELIEFCWTDSWEENDGLVPKRSSMSPEIGTNGYVTPSSRDNAGYWSWGIWYWNFQPGTWYTTHHNRDHIQIIGLDNQWLWLESPDTGTYDDIRQDVEWMDARTVSAEAGNVQAQQVQGGQNQNLIIGLVTPLTVLFGVALTVAIVVRRRRTQRTARDAAVSRANSVLSIGTQAVDNPAFSSGASPDDFPVKKFSPNPKSDASESFGTNTDAAGLARGDSALNLLRSPMSASSFSSSPRVVGHREFQLSRGDSLGGDSVGVSSPRLERIEVVNLEEGGGGARLPNKVPGMLDV